MKNPERPDPRRRNGLDELVEETGEESFPASDPPSWTPSRSGTPSDRPDHPVGNGNSAQDRQADGDDRPNRSDTSR